MKRNLYSLRPCLLLFFLVVLAGSCRKEEDPLVTEPQDDLSLVNEAERCYQPQSFQSEIAQKWYSLLLQIIPVTAGHTPPIAARDIGYTGIVLYESVIGGLQGHQSMGGQLSALPSLPARQNGKHYIAVVSANAGMARIVKYMMANASVANLARIDSLENANELYYGSLYTTGDITRSRDFGRAIADAIYNWSISDGGHQAYLNIFPSYTPPAGSGLWVPTPPLFQSAMLPSWGTCRAFVPANNASTIDPPPPPAFSTTPGSAMYIAANLVYSTGVNLTQPQKDIANHWADGGGTFTPPGHLIAIALQVIRNKNLNLRDASILLGKIGVSMNDAGIVCWRAKFAHNLLRPVTYIKSYIDPNWTSFIGTPPFPSYTSGHSTFSSSAARILTLRFGNHFAFKDSTKTGAGMAVRSFTSFTQAAQEAALSRLYGGIHYDFDNSNGFDCGTIIANNVAALNW